MARICGGLRNFYDLCRRFCAPFGALAQHGDSAAVAASAAKTLEYRDFASRDSAMSMSAPVRGSAVGKFCVDCYAFVL